MERKIRIKMTVRDAIKLYPDLLDEPIENMCYPTDNIIPRIATFQLRGDGNYRSRQLQRGESTRTQHINVINALRSQNKLK